MRIFSVISFVFLLGVSTASAVQSNYEVADSLMQEISKSYCEELKARGAESVELKIGDSDTEKLLKYYLVEYGANYGLKFNAGDSEASLEPIIKKIVFDYGKSSESGEIIRTATLETAAVLKIDSEYLTLPERNLKYTDTIPEDQIPTLERSEFDFVVGSFPEDETGFIKKYGEPLILISSAALTVILLFSVRS